MPLESLFDGRYRYDYIYPRGRSGEALRAYDTYHDDRPVVIKRPAPQDAPPIRAGQEINIRTERRVLLQLKGHPALTDLLEEGTFQVGGHTHLYIVMERATGQLLEDMVLDLASRNERLPELEMLTILDALLGLLEEAHKHEIVYNDVDAKHLFWDRDQYQLKVIDWGNAVFLEGDETTPQGVSRQSDIYQVGELLYFILTGGQRLVLDGESVAFGEDEKRIPTRLRSIVQYAAHPNPDRRYRDISILRRDLAEYRRPLERDRAAALERIERRLKAQRSQRELERLLQDVKAVQAQDPGYPPARALCRQIEAESERLAILSDLDAARIYLESANWPRAIALLQEVSSRATGAERQHVQILLEAAQMIQQSGLHAPPAGFAPALAALMEKDAARAARILLTTPETHPEARLVQWLIAERVQAHVPEVMVLRPHLVRLRWDLLGIAPQYGLQGVLRAVEEASNRLESAPSGTLSDLVAVYQDVAAVMQDIVVALTQARERIGEEDITALVTAAQHAAEAASAVAQRLQVAGSQATADPDAATTALAEAVGLDPVNPAFAALRTTLEGAQRLVMRLSGYSPLADGSDLMAWLGDSLTELNAFVNEISDPRLNMYIGSLQDARTAWEAYQEAAVAGNRRGAVDALNRAAEAVRRLNPKLATWFDNVRGVVAKARYVQRHALNIAFGRAMADGWSAWDRGSGIEAERLGRQALEEVASEAERAAADRLIRLGKVLRTWQEGHGEGDPQLTASLDAEVLTLFTEEEERHWQTFTKQMPSSAAYLKAMGTGLVQHFEETSTAAQRILFMHYVLRGVQEMYEQPAKDPDFWRVAAEHALPNARRHIAYLALTNVIRDRQEISALAGQIENVTAPADLVEVLHRLETSSLRLVLNPLTETLRGVTQAFSEWERGHFQAAGSALEAATTRLGEGERLAHVRLPRFRDWLGRLGQVAAELHVTRRRIEEAGEASDESPDPRLSEWHQKLVQETERLLGAEYTRHLVAWRDTYHAMLSIYTDEGKRRSRKLRDFDELFHAAAIDEHPAYRLYRFWRDTVEARPEFPAPPTDEPVPRYTDGGVLLPPRSPYPAAALQEEALARPRSRLHLSRQRLLWGGALLVTALAVIFWLSLLSSVGGGGPSIPVTWETATPTLGTQEVAAATIAAVQTATAVAEAASATPTATTPPSDTPTPSPSPTHTIVPTLASGGELPTSDLPGPTDTPAPTETATETPTPFPTIPPTVTPVPELLVATPTGPLRGRQDVLLALEQYAQAYPWPNIWFRPGELSGGWLLGFAERAAGDGTLQVVLPADLLSQVFGEDAAVRLRRIEVTFSLREYDRALVPEGQVYFGLGLQGADESRVAVQIQLVREDAINIGVRAGDEFRARTTLPVNEIQAVLALDRHDDGTVDLLFNGEAVGPARFLTAPNAPVMPFLFVHQGGVVVSVTNLIAELE